MRRVLVVGMIVAGLGVAAHAGSFSGSYEATLCFGVEGTPASVVLDDMWSFLEVDYATCGWTFGSNATLDEDGLDKIWFTASGGLGAFTAKSILVFDPATSEFKAFDTVVDVTLAGVEFYGMFNLGRNGGDIAVGGLVGGIGRLGECTIGVELDYGGILPNLWYAYLWGPAFALYPYDGWEVCPGLYYAEIGWFLTEDCSPGLTGVQVLAVFPFTCLTVTTIVDFSCAEGFDSACFHVFDIDLGAGWFDLAALAICFEPEGKSICADLDLTLGDAICVRPYFDLVFDGDYQVTGIELNALTLTYEVNGVTFKAGEIFDRTWELDDPSLTACESALYNPYTWRFTRTGAISYSWYGSSCWYSVQDGDVEYLPNEMFGVSIDGDSCCGGAFAFDAYSFFIAGERDAYGIFGWIGSFIQVAAGIGPRLSVGFALDVTFLDDVQLQVSFRASW